MAADVRSGTGNITYTNTTGQNVRVIINYMSSPTAISWTGASITASNVLAIGRNLAFSAGATTASLIANNMCVTDTNESVNVAFPTEIMLASGNTFTATFSAYNIVIIPEAG